MKYQQLIQLLPCHGIEDFPTQHEGDKAQGLLAGWSAAWHPALLAAAQATPSLYRANSPPEEVANKLFIAPSVGAEELPAGFSQRVQAGGGVLIQNQLDRQAIVAEALAHLDGGGGGVNPALAADFLALGYGYLQLAILTRQVRYSYSLDDHQFQQQAVAAATAAMQGDETTARDKIASCLDLLAEERDRYSTPVEALLVDVTLVVPQTIGPALLQELSQDRPLNLLLSASTLAAIETTAPDTWAAVRQALTEQRLGLMGGDEVEQRWPLLSLESLLAGLRRGLAGYTARLGQRPTVYGRRRFGLMPMLPQVLKKLGFEAVLHATLDGGVFPEGSQVKISWESGDGTSLHAIARPPLDATQPATFLKFGLRLGESLQNDHLAVLCLAHWPGQSSPWYEDLRRIARYSPVLGKFVTCEEYFRNTAVSMQQQRFQADQYRSPYLRQAVAAGRVDPISCVVRYWRRRAAVEACQALQSLAAFAAGKPPAEPEQAAVAQLAEAVDARCEDGGPDEWDVRLDQALHNATEQFAAALPRTPAAAGHGYLVANPSSYVRRIGVEMPQLESLPAVAPPIYAAAERAVVVDVPPLGYVWVQSPAGRTAAQAEPPLADSCRLQNEFFEALIDPATGGLRAFRKHGARTNRLSQQLAFRQPPPGTRSADAEAEADAAAVSGYSRMVSEGIETTIATPALGEIVSRGRLLDRHGKPLAGFRQTFRLWRGSRVLHLKVELEPQAECTDRPWDCYYAARFAWANEGAELFRSVNQTRQPTTAKWFEAPHYVEIDDGSTRTAILTGGLPFHRRHGLRMLDSLLIVRGERCREFQFGIGFDVRQTMQEALNLLAPPTAVFQTAPPPAPSDSGWLFHIDARNVLATHIEPLSDAGAVTGVRLRLLETGGRPTKAQLSCFRAVQSARQTDFQGQTLADCPIQDGRVQLELASHAWQQIEVRW